MAVTKTLTKAVPHVKSSKVEKWDLEMKYENDSEGDATYYTSTFSTNVNNALCPTSQWDAVFASQVDSVITNPPANPVPDTSYSIPS